MLPPVVRDITDMLVLQPTLLSLLVSLTSRACVCARELVYIFSVCTRVSLCVIAFFSMCFVRVCVFCMSVFCVSLCFLCVFVCLCFLCVFVVLRVCVWCVSLRFVCVCLCLLCVFVFCVFGVCLCVFECVLCM